MGEGRDFTTQWSVRAPIASSTEFWRRTILVFDIDSDVARAQIFLADLKKFESEGKLPNLMLVQLPSNHTFGASPGLSTPKAMVAITTWHWGQIVEALTHSRFWPKMAIFIWRTTRRTAWIT